MVQNLSVHKMKVDFLKHCRFWPKADDFDAVTAGSFLARKLERILEYVI